MMMKNWVNQTGFPLVSIETGAGSSVRIKQQRYFADPGRMGSAEDQTWEIPMVIRFRDSEGVKTHRVMVTRADQTIELPAKGDVQWVWPNAEATGFYRSQPDAAGLKALLAGGLKDLTPAERTALFDQMVERSYQRGKAVNTASHFELDDVIDPMDSRHWITSALRSVPPVTRTGKKRPCIDTW